MKRYASYGYDEAGCLGELLVLDTRPLDGGTRGSAYVRHALLHARALAMTANAFAEV